MPMRRRMARRAARGGAGTQEPAAPSQAAPQPTPQGSSAPGGSSTHQMSELKQLGELHEQGVLTDEEFEAQKKKILTTL